MTPEDQERLDELKERLDNDEELDEDELDELRELRSMAREEKRTAKALAKFDKARVVFRVVDPDEGDFYTLDLATAQQWAHGRAIQELDRKTLDGKFHTALMGGFYGDGDDFGYVEVYVKDEV